MSILDTLYTAMYNEQLTEVILPSIQNIIEICYHATICIFIKLVLGW